MSVFQEYGFQDVKKVAELYDKVVKGVYEKIKTIVNNFHAVVTSFKNYKPREIFQELVDSIKNMPDKVSPLLHSRGITLKESPLLNSNRGILLKVLVSPLLHSRVIALKEVLPLK